MEEIDFYKSEDIRIDQKMLSVFQVVRWIDQESLILQPEFQRNYVWNNEQKSLLIESLMLRIPIPAFYFDEDKDGRRSVIDGLQRLTTIRDFWHGKFRLRGLQYLKDCEGLFFDQLDWKYQSRIEDTQLAINILDAKCPSMIKFDIFRRINTGGEPLKSQEVRNIMAVSQTRIFLKDLVRSKEFLDATHGKVNDRRMGAQELCLRFFAYREIYDMVSGQFVEFGRMPQLLDRTLLMINDFDVDEICHYKQLFLIAMRKCYLLFGDKAFYTPGVKNKVNNAMFVSFAVIISYCDLSDAYMLDRRRIAVELFAKIFCENEEYSAAIKSATSSRQNMEIQFRYARKILEEALNWKS